mgnify:CR=1 FL=1
MSTERYVLACEVSLAIRNASPSPRPIDDRMTARIDRAWRLAFRPTQTAKYPGGAA